MLPSCQFEIDALWLKGFCESVNMQAHTYAVTAYAGKFFFVVVKGYERFSRYEYGKLQSGTRYITYIYQN